MKEINLTQNKVALVDNEDYAFLTEEFHWVANKQRGIWYVIGYRKNKTTKPIKMHRLLTNCHYLKFVDHIDGNGLNNQKSNLRICTNTQNQQNRGKPKIKTSSKYKCVSKYNAEKKWTSRVRVNGKNVYGGKFEREDDAAKKSDEIIKKYHGDFAKLNFPVLSRK